MKLSVHRLVCEAFHGPCPPGNLARHLNDIKGDNRAINLAWGTRCDNWADAKRNGYSGAGDGHPQSILTEADVVSLRLRALNGEKVSAAAADMGLPLWAAHAAARSKTWKHVDAPCIPAKAHQILTDADVVAIRHRVASGDARRVIADSYGVAVTTVSDLASGRRRPGPGGPITKVSPAEAARRSVAARIARRRAGG